MKINKTVLLLMTGIYLLLLWWGLSSIQCFDDDAVTRFFQVKNAFNDPSQFFSIWNRPAFTLLFVLPLQLGKNAIVFGMGLIFVLTLLAVYKTTEKLEIPHGYLAIILTAFQPFFFSVSHNAMTEPLAACIIAWGILFYVNKKYIWFALIGGLLPLARLELSILLTVWLVALLWDGQYRWIPLLAVPTLLWNFSGALFYGDGLWLWDATIGKEYVANRYGSTPFWSYFQRYIFVVGPVVFYFLLIYLFKRISALRLTSVMIRGDQSGHLRNAENFILGQFIVGFMIYVIFSWKINMGNSAGFLRNLVSLSPLAGLLAMFGFEKWVREDKDKIIYYSIAIFLVVLSVMSKKLIMHHIIGVEWEFWKVGIIAAIFWIWLLKTNVYFKSLRWIPVVLSVLLVSYTLVTEPPDANNNPEREVVSAVAEWCKNAGLDDRKIYSNHIWFYWSGGFNYYSHGRMRIEEIEKASPGSILIWENHYSTRLNGNVPMQYLVDNQDKYAIRRVYQTDDQRFGLIVLEKL